MWVLLARPPLPDATPWPGRRLLAAIDALAWPAAWVAAVVLMPVNVGAVGQLVIAGAMVAALRRLHRAVALNHRYHFTTWTWGRRVGLMLLFGGALKLATMFRG
jgi:hypothetical protein